MGTGSVLDADQQLQYLSSTMQIYHPASGLCLDDGGKEVLGSRSLAAYLSFAPCDSSSINQQFIFTTNYQIYNPNWPNNQVCLFGAGNTYNGYPELLLWDCEADESKMFNFILVCAPGMVSGSSCAHQTHVCRRYLHVHGERHELLPLPRRDVLVHRGNCRKLHSLPGRQLLPHRLISAHPLCRRFMSS